jgi:MFS family permease
MGVDLAATRAGRRVLFTALYFVEGAPIGFLWWALPSLLASRGMAEARIGALLGWLVLPWALKFLWAPLIDRWQGPRWSLRAWIVAAQLGMAAALVPLFAAGVLEREALLATALLAHAVCASTQDAAIDALMIRATPPEERGRLAGWMQAGMLSGRSLLGGGALLVVARVGERGLAVSLVAVIVGGLALSALYRDPGPAPPDGGPRVAFAALLREVLSRRVTWVGLAFAAVAGAGFEALGGFAGPLLTHAAGGEVASAGRFFLVHAVVATVAGGLVAGALADRAGARRATFVWGLALGAALFATAWRVAGGAETDELFAWLAAVYFGIGGFVAASYAVFMELTDERLAATQFSAYMGATNLCEAWSVRVAGRMIEARGYGATFALLEAVGLAGLGLLAFARARGPVSHPREKRPPERFPGG